ncbi:alpha/beta fold hydrolase [Plantactinospora sp. WMMB334]|uniref:alpha/beta fold hydrolase n=1 Tax=Plantactinospora sp. WMMB334 TaxID=3404119 RepID=UPI003B92F1A6
MAHRTYRFGHYELDIDGLELRQCGLEVRIEPRAFDVLCYLATHRHRIVSKDELLRAVWPDGFITEAALSTALRTARLAVGDTGTRQEVIRTHHRRGYQFLAGLNPPPATTPGTDDATAPASPPDGRDCTTSAETVSFCFTNDGTRIAYAASGTGPPLVKAANWLAHLDLDRTCPMWTHWADELTQSRRLIRYDARGGGMSDWCPPARSPEQWVDELDAVADAAGLDRFPLVAAADGTAIAIAYAALRPERVTRMVLVGTHARGRHARADTGLDQKAADLDLDLATVGWQTRNRRYLRAFAAQFLPNAPAEAWDSLIDFQRRTTSPGNAIRMLETMSHADMFPFATKITCPTLILHSRGDTRVPATEATELAALISGSRLVTLDSRNHLLTAAEPARAVAGKHITDFLAE